jgi:hypothetical protein
MAGPSTTSRRSTTTLAAHASKYVWLQAALRLFFVLLGAAMFLLNAWFLYYMDRLERDGCKCAQGWKRTFIQISLIAFLFMALVSIFVNVEGHWFVVAVLFQALTISYVLITRQFITEIKSEQCLCAETPAFKVLDVVNMAQLVLLATSMVAAFIIVTRMATAGPGHAVAAAS